MNAIIDGFAYVEVKFLVQLRPTGILSDYYAVSGGLFFSLFSKKNASENVFFGLLSGRALRLYRSSRKLTFGTVIGIMDASFVSRVRSCAFIRTYNIFSRRRAALASPFSCAYMLSVDTHLSVSFRSFELIMRMSTLVYVYFKVFVLICSFSIDLIDDMPHSGY